MRILIIYICTNKYFSLLPMFNKNVCNFLPGIAKTIIVLSDKVNEHYKERQLDDYTNEIYYKIDDTPWPIPMLLKFHYIKEFMSTHDNYTHVVYFNANAKIRQMSSTYWEDLISIIMNHDILLTNHAHLNANPLSYTQSGFILSKYHVMLDICNRIIDRIDNKYLRYNKIPKWHDETALNEIIEDLYNNYKIFKTPFMEDPLNPNNQKTVFITLVTKQDYFILNK